MKKFINRAISFINMNTEKHIENILGLEMIDSDLKLDLAIAYELSIKRIASVESQKIRELAQTVVDVISIWQEPYQRFVEQQIYAPRRSESRILTSPDGLIIINGARNNVMSSIILREAQICPEGKTIEDYFSCVEFPEPSLWRESEVFQYEPVNHAASKGLIYNASHI